MAAFSLRSDLQRAIFTPQQERLLAVSPVWKASSRRRKRVVLCAAVGSDSWGQVTLATVKEVRGHYKLSTRWPASELSVVDGTDAAKETAEFHLHLEKVYRWETDSPVEKRALITCLWNINHRYLQDRVKFVNISPDILEEVLPWQHGRVSEEREEDGKVEEEEEAFQELTAREAADVQRLMEESDLAVSNAKAFTKALHASLADMDQENLQALLMSEFQVEQLLKLLDEALEEVGHIEEVLSQHDRLLRSVQRQIETLHTYGAWLQSVDHNHKQLQSELCHLVDGLSLSEEHVHVLTKGDLQDVDQVRACVTAVTALSRCSSVSLTAGQRRLQGVAEQLIRFESLRQNFEQRLSLHINNAIVLQGQGRSLQWEEDLILKPGRFHKQLLQYAPLMCWLRESSPRVFQQLTKVYAENIGRLFDRQMKDFFDAARLQLSIAKETKKTGTLPASTTARGTGSDFVPLSSESIASQVVHQVLSQLELVCVLEQQFLTVFFSLDRGLVSVEFPATRRGSAVDQVQSCAELRQKRRPHSWFSAGSGLPEPVVGEWDCVRSVLGCVEPRLGALLSLCERAEPLNCLASLKAAGAGLSRHQNSPNASFWCSVLHSTVQHSQRCLRNYTDSLCAELESMRVLKKARVGVLPAVSRLEEFVREGQAVLGSSEQRWGLDEAYTRLITKAFQALDALSGQSARCSPLVVKLQNYHQLSGFLRRVGLPQLRALEEEAGERTSLRVQEYIRSHLGKPFGSLSDFLDGVRGCLAHGVREEEVCFQLAYSKQELRRLTAPHSGWEVQRNLEALYKKIGRDLGDNPVLMQVVWRAVQQAFVTQYHSFESLVGRCYPVAGVSLDFTAQDLQGLFSSISARAKTGT